jgi:hypothetical protein
VAASLVWAGSALATNDHPPLGADPVANPLGFGGFTTPCYDPSSGELIGTVAARFYATPTPTPLLLGFDASNTCPGWSVIHLYPEAGSLIRIAVEPGTVATVGREELQPLGLWPLHVTSVGGGNHSIPQPACFWEPDFLLTSDGVLSPATC